MSRRVVITGLGVLSGAGANVAEFQRNITAGVCCLSPITDPRAAHFKSRYAGLLAGTAAATLEPLAELAGFDRYVQMAMVAAREALAVAAARPENFGRRLGLIFATCSGPMLLIEAHYERIIRGDLRLTEEEWLARQYYTGARVLARELGVQGLSTTVVTACSASTAAMALAADLIRCGMLDAALAGGADAFSTSTLAGFEGLKATSEGKCAPFSKPFGLNLGEAAAFVFLESLTSARKRQVAIQAEILGSGMSNDAFHCSAPEPAGRGLATAMQRALADAGLSPEQISYINAHGTGTEANDKAEAKAVRKVFGAQAERTPISSTKSMVGHCLGAAGAVEAIAGIVCAKSGVLPPTANFTGPREGCALDCVPEAGRAWLAPQVFLSNNSAFGGHNASVVLSVSISPSPPSKEERGGVRRPIIQAQIPSPQPSPRSGGERESATVLSCAQSQISDSSQSLLASAATVENTEPIYITACGVVSAAGIGVEALDRVQRNGKSVLRPVAIPGLPPMLAGMVDEKGVETFDRRLDLRHMDRSSRWATVAARLAIREAGFSERPSALAKLGLFLNLSAGPSWAESEYLTSFLSNNRQVTQLTAFPYIVPGSVAGNVCRALGLAGHNLTLSVGPGAGLLGLGPAIAALRTGHAEALLSGAVDELSERILTDQFMAGLSSGKDALPPGEGAAVLLLETARHAAARGVRPLAEVCGMAYATEADRCCRPNPDEQGLVEIVRDALNQAGFEPAEIGALCFHGPRRRLEQLQAQMHPTWAARVLTASRLTGCLEGTQPLLDLAVALRSQPAGSGNPPVLAVVASPQGTDCALVFRMY
ncbi:MAG: beta-ketoacyl-[acyl-carrier-protein] synthase family protein [Verrucomicrobiota bacterium]|jgi:3-oxoacyl-[acyl-carrier-protein] synthase II